VNIQDGRNDPWWGSSCSAQVTINSSPAIRSFLDSSSYPRPGFPSYNSLRSLSYSVEKVLKAPQRDISKCKAAEFSDRNLLQMRCPCKDPVAVFPDKSKEPLQIAILTALVWESHLQNFLVSRVLSERESSPPLNFLDQKSTDSCSQPVSVPVNIFSCLFLHPSSSMGSTDFMLDCNYLVKSEQPDFNPDWRLKLNWFLLPPVFLSLLSPPPNLQFLCWIPRVVGLQRETAWSHFSILVFLL
jgi:hypothetical protein